MKGSILFLRKVREICIKHNGDCKRCPLGDKKKVEDNLCPRLLNPGSLSDEKILNMINI